MHACMLMCVCMWRLGLVMLDVFLYDSPTCFIETELTSWVDWLAGKPLGPSRLCFPVLGCLFVCLKWVLWLWTQVTLLAHKHFTHSLNRLPRLNERLSWHDVLLSRDWRPTHVYSWSDALPKPSCGKQQNFRSPATTEGSEKTRTEGPLLFLSFTLHKKERDSVTEWICHWVASCRLPWGGERSEPNIQ